MFVAAISLTEAAVPEYSAAAKIRFANKRDGSAFCNTAVASGTISPKPVGRGTLIVVATPSSRRRGVTDRQTDRKIDRTDRL